jgi:outer membrane protein OmpA-like peptidoglycan-associated protein
VLLNNRNTVTALSAAEQLQVAQKKIDSILSPQERPPAAQEKNDTASAPEEPLTKAQGQSENTEVADQTADLRKDLPPPRALLPLENKKFIVFFEHDSNNLPAQTIEVLNRIIDLVMNFPFSDIIVKGYTDSLGDALYNKKLSADRANRIKAYFIDRGLAGSKIKVYGMGPNNPIESNATRQGRRQNRRVEIELSVEHDNEFDHLTARLQKMS